MKALIQRVSSASVSVDGNVVGSVGAGFLVLLGVCEKDEEKHADVLAQKTANIRIFSDADDKMNLSLLDTSGEVLVISNFTLCADCSHGRRPSFIGAAAPQMANELYLKYVDNLVKLGVKKVQTGIFGADMKVKLLNDGPVTVMLDTDDFKMKG